ncbi:hypothetical protein ALC56_02300 [Trachymyrmex septentrionalis]|uniref:Uncharacterized protein n=1 Tax=Trachymyrmex septentrionalis TaxID=34720 RepID=A0A151K0M8_9HYME|nr:hypothetical protein ALC56_02300 [Trachymyrmex septentrionalis]
MLPTTIRAICSPSNCGKTNVFISLIESPNGVRFENVYVYSKSLQQSKYQYLENLFTSTDEIGYFTFSNNSDVVSPSEARPNFIFILDDVACDKQDAAREYFSMDHHANVDCFYLRQTYARIPKHLIHDNKCIISIYNVFLFLVFFKKNQRNLDEINLGSECQEYLNELMMQGHENVVTIVRSNCLMFYVTAAEEICKRLPVNDALPNSNADAKRTFSFKKRNKLSPASINATCIVKSALKARGETSLSMIIEEKHLSHM